MGAHMHTPIKLLIENETTLIYLLFIYLGLFIYLRFEVFAAVKKSVVFFCVVTPSTESPGVITQNTRIVVLISMFDNGNKSSSPKTLGYYSMLTRLIASRKLQILSK
jgi:hypothetical protein